MHAPFCQIPIQCYCKRSMEGVTHMPNYRYHTPDYMHRSGCGRPASAPQPSAPCSQPSASCSQPSMPCSQPAPLFCNLQTDISSQNPFIFRIAGIFLCQVLCIFTLYYIAFHVKQWYNNLRGVIVCTLRRASTKKETRHSFLLYKDTVLMGK